MFTSKISSKKIFGIFLIVNTMILGAGNSLKAQVEDSTFQVEDSTFLNILNQIVNSTNDNLPMMVNEYTRWDSASMIPGEEMVYNYTLVNYSSTDIDSQTFSQTVNQVAINEACKNPSLQVFYQNGMALKYNYFSNDESLISHVEISPADCGY